MCFYGGFDLLDKHIEDVVFGNKLIELNIEKKVETIP